jgi:lipopolysaccharide export LptBFGC system permease protein LptF
MTRDHSPYYRMLFLILGCVCFRLLSSVFPDFIPNISPLIAVAFVGAMYLPRAWGWLVGPATLVITDVAFLSVNYRTEGSMFSAWTLVSLVFYALAGGLGILIARNKSLGKIAAGSIACSVIFYLVSNTFAWWGNSNPAIVPSYMPSLAGWWQANTVGLPGWVETWTFLRNGVIGDLCFAFVLLLILDRGLLFHRAPGHVASRAA